MDLIVFVLSWRRASVNQMMHTCPDDGFTIWLGRWSSLSRISKRDLKVVSKNNMAYWSNATYGISLQNFVMFFILKEFSVRIFTKLALYLINSHFAHMIWYWLTELCEVCTVNKSQMPKSTNRRRSFNTNTNSKTSDSPLKAKEISNTMV